NLIFFYSSRKREMVPMKSLDEARKSFGTDEDILLVGIVSLGCVFNLRFSSCYALMLCVSPALVCRII
uniref:Uncharacterized protein n=1 Tax=Aegilops tauschii subsp. strangulata TaxID=200361 RepID=A0A452Z8H9_AEGTS